jgi:Isochorismatase family
VRGTVEKAFGLEIPQSLEDACHPRRLALLLYDMQVGILHQLSERAAIIAAVLRTLDAARGAGIRVVFLRHMSLPIELAGVYQLRQAMAWQNVTRATDVRPWFLRDTPGFELEPALAPRPSEAIFDKFTFSAFEGTPLDIALPDCGSTHSRSAASRPRSGSSRRSGTAPTSATSPSSSPTPAAPVIRRQASERSRASSSWATPSSSTWRRSNESSPSDRPRESPRKNRVGRTDHCANRVTVSAQPLAVLQLE